MIKACVNFIKINYKFVRLIYYLVKNYFTNFENIIEIESIIREYYKKIIIDSTIAHVILL